MSEPVKNSRKWFYVWLLASLCWAGLVGWNAYIHWPQVPLDMSGLDAETQKVYTEALVSHVLHAGLFGLGIPLVVYVIGRLIGKFTQ
jgi:Na+/proline symporter